MTVHRLHETDRPPSPRARLEAAIEAAITALDDMDPDPDLEPEEDAEHDGCEPELGDGAVEYASDHDQTSVPAALGWKP